MNHNSTKINRSEILILIKQSKFDEVLEIINSSIAKRELKALEHDLAILSQDYYSLRNERLRNVISDELFQIRENQFIQSLLTLVEKADNQLNSKTLNRTKILPEKNESKFQPAEDLTKNKGCLFSIANSRTKLILQVALVGFILFCFGSILRLEVDKSTNKPANEVTNNTKPESNNTIPNSVEKRIIDFLDKDSNDKTKSFSGRGLLNSNQFLDILKNYPNCRLRINNYSDLNIEEIQILQEAVLNSGISSRVIIEDISAFSSAFDYKIIVTQ